MENDAVFGCESRGGTRLRSGRSAVDWRRSGSRRSCWLGRLPPVRPGDGRRCTMFRCRPGPARHLRVLSNPPEAIPSRRALRLEPGCRGTADPRRPRRCRSKKLRTRPRPLCAEERLATSLSTSLSIGGSAWITPAQARGDLRPFSSDFSQSRQIGPLVLISWLLDSLSAPLIGKIDSR